MFGSNPSITVKRGTASGDDRMNVRVMLQLLVSGVKDHHGGRMILASLPQAMIQRSPSRTEQETVQLLAIAKNQWRELVG
jgi:hypothetical protein